MICDECGEALDLVTIDQGNALYRCTNGHWWELNRTEGWRPISMPEGWVDPSATGFPEDE